MSMCRLRESIKEVIFNTEWFFWNLLSDREWLIEIYKASQGGWNYFWNINLFF